MTETYVDLNCHFDKIYSRYKFKSVLALKECHVKNHVWIYNKKLVENQLVQLSHAWDSIEFELKLIPLTSKRQSPWHMSEVVKHISEIKLEMCP